MKKIGILFFVGFIFLNLGCENNRRDVVIKDNLAIIPRPVSVKVDNNQFYTLNKISIWTDEALLNSFYDSLVMKTGLQLEKAASKETANLVISKDGDIKPEGYYLKVNENGVLITASDKSGAQYGLTSLFQMYRYNGSRIPFCRIQDKPKFSYRGMHLDVGRHLFSVTDIKKYLDYMAEYKYNHFHWHLTEDQGWRIEIKKYPKLTEIGAFRKETLKGHYNDEPHQFDGVRYGGFYTQEEVKDIVKYASERSITIVPEIEMPGHALAALASYPHLGCGANSYEVGTKWGVFPEVFCPYDSTFMFLQDVLDEVMTLFPGKYIHIGGDECPKDSWKASEFCQNLIKEQNLKDEYGLQSYFIQRIEKYINSKGKQIIGWDEILEGGLAPNATVMSWRGNEGGIEAANEGHNVIMTPGSHCYFDHYQSDREDEPLAIGGLTTLDKVYEWLVIPNELTGSKKKYVLGGQANLWTEYISTFGQLEYMAYSRGLAMAEALWSEGKNYNNFLTRYEKHNDYIKSNGVNIANHLYDVKLKPEKIKSGELVLHFEGMEGMKVICFSPKGDSAVVSLKESYLLTESGVYRFKGVKGTDKFGKETMLKVDLHKGTVSNISGELNPSEKYFGGGLNALINGIEGSNQKYGGNEWLGFEGTDCNVVIELPTADSIKFVELKFFKGEGQWIYLPSQIKILSSLDNKNFEPVFQADSVKSDTKIARVQAETKGLFSKYIKVQITNHGVIGEGFQGAGHRAWLFVDEIKIY
jgi:hexosaminidase